MQAFLLHNSIDTSKQMEKHERFLQARKNSGMKSDTFVDNTDVITKNLVREVSKKAIQFKVTFSNNKAKPDKIYHGQGGLILTEAKVPRKRETQNKKRKLIDTALTVTARHNLESRDGDKRELIQIRTAEVSDRTITMPDAGNKSERKFIIVRKKEKKEVKESVSWIEKEVFYGEPIRIHNSPFKVENLFEKVPNSFTLAIDDNIGIAVFRTFNLGSNDHHSANKVWGKTEQKCGIYTGKITEFHQNKAFCHDINTFKGCSGAVVFLLDVQQRLLASMFRGKAIGIHVGGLEGEGNLAFLF
jgi:hypothetical protein